MYFAEKKTLFIFSSKYFDLDCVFILNTGDDHEQGIPQHCLVKGASHQQPQPRFQIKTMS